MDPLFWNCPCFPIRFPFYYIVYKLDGDVASYLARVVVKGII